MKAVVIYASRKGSTEDIAKRVSYTLNELNVATDLVNTVTTSTFASDYDAILLLTPIYKGLWLQEMTQFVRRNRKIIGETPIYGLFPCIRVLEESGKQYAYANYLPQHLVSGLNLVDVRFIAGKLERSEITLDDIETLSTRYDGDNLNKISGDYRDWREILGWVQLVANQIQRSYGTEPKVIL